MQQLVTWHQHGCAPTIGSSLIPHLISPAGPHALIVIRRSDLTSLVDRTALCGAEGKRALRQLNTVRVGGPSEFKGWARACDSEIGSLPGKSAKPQHRAHSDQFCVSQRTARALQPTNSRTTSCQ
jgi:hypothetical protein